MIISDTLYKVSMKLDENWGRHTVFRNLKLDISQSAPNDHKLKKSAMKSIYLYIYALLDTESQIFVCYALWSAVFEIFLILDFPV